jgi:hypothetical protein
VDCGLIHDLELRRFVASIGKSISLKVSTLEAVYLKNFAQ